MSEGTRSQDAPIEPEEDEERPAEPRIRVVKGKPWRIDAGRRAKWSAADFTKRHAADIRQVGDPVLHRPAIHPKLTRPYLEALVARMYASMVAAQGIGIAAPQIGLSLRVAIMDVDEAGIVAIDPVVEETSEEVVETSEGCLSVRGFYGILERPVGARVSAKDVAGKRFVIEGVGLGAQNMLHETGHLRGELYVDLLRSREDLHVVEPDEAEEADT